MAVMMQAFYWDAPRHENKEHEWWNFVAEKVRGPGSRGLQRAVAAAGEQGIEHHVDGLRSVRLLRPGRLRPEGRNEDLVWQSRGVGDADREGAQARRRAVCRHGDQPQRGRGRGRNKPHRRAEALDEVQSQERDLSARLQPLPPQPLRAGDHGGRKLRGLSASVPSQPGGVRGDVPLRAAC